MHYEIPIFPRFAVGECEAWPGYLPSPDAARLESIHKWLRAAISNAPEERERLVCEAVQKTFDMLKQIHQANGSLNRHVLVEELPPKAFGLALDCGWLPARARIDRGAWRQWIKELLEGRYSQVGLSDSCSVDPYMFVKFPPEIIDAERVPARSETAETGDRNGADPVATERSALLTGFKVKAREQGIRVTDEMVAKAAKPGKWNQRTMVTWWKANDPRCKPPHDKSIRAVLHRDPATIWPNKVKISPANTANTAS